MKKKYWIIMKAHYLDGDSIQELVDLFPSEQFQENWYRYYPDSLLIEITNYHDHELDRAKSLAFDLGWCALGNNHDITFKSVKDKIVLDPL